METVIKVMANSGVLLLYVLGTLLALTLSFVIPFGLIYNATTDMTFSLLAASVVSGFTIFWALFLFYMSK